RAALLHAAFRAAPAGAARLVWAGVLLPDALALPPERALAWAADALVPILLAAGESERAGEWLALLAEAARPTAAELAAADALLPYRALLGRLDATAIEALAGEEALLALIDGLGVAVPAGSWLRALEARPAAPTRPAPPLAVWRGLERAVADGRRGEALAWLLLLLDGAPEAASPPALASALRALGALGLEREALALAAATAVAQGR
ncbi:MAG TPA: hypothetical protein VFG43_16925, partial [Geminicoccaceae bacterium]|nr:hypothetical protein [Geminicoccaceae bacterium]